MQTLENLHHAYNIILPTQVTRLRILLFDLSYNVSSIFQAIFKRYKKKEASLMESCHVGIESSCAHGVLLGRMRAVRA